MMDGILKGRLERWNDEKGFGFIRPEKGNGDVFMPISALKKSSRRPISGDVIHYQLHIGADGKTKAINARIEGAPLLKSKKLPGNNKNNRYQLVGYFVAVLLVVAAGLLLYGKISWRLPNQANAPTESGAGSVNSHDSMLQDAYLHQLNNIQVEGEGTVLKLLPDDSEGSKHQKFIVRLSSGQTLLIAHNIELAPRMDSLHVGDRISFYGEYEWNEKGGLIHWTHHDPGGDHIAGWLKHDGQTYQ